MSMCSQLGLGMSNVGMLEKGLCLKRKPINCGSYQDLPSLEGVFQHKELGNGYDLEDKDFLHTSSGG
jgi:hypothetical protein